VIPVGRGWDWHCLAATNPLRMFNLDYTLKTMVSMSLIVTNLPNIYK